MKQTEAALDLVDEKVADLQERVAELRLLTDRTRQALKEVESGNDHGR